MKTTVITIVGAIFISSIASAAETQKSDDDRFVWPMFGQADVVALVTGTSPLGDDDLRQESHQAVRRMVERLQDINPHQPPVKNAPPTTEVQIASTWLLGDRPRNLLPSSLYDQLSELIEKLITGQPKLSTSNTSPTNQRTSTP